MGLKQNFISTSLCRKTLHSEMACGTKALLLVAALVAVRYLSQPAFVPPALRKAAPVAIPAAAVLGASPAFADKISEASKKFSADPQKTLKAIDKVLVMASAMDGKALQTAVEAHHKAISSMDGKGVTSLADYTAINDALGRVIAGVPEKLTKDVFYAFADISPKTLPEYIFKTVDGPAAYKAAGVFFEFKDTIKAAR